MLAINSNALRYLKSLIDPNNEIIDLEVRNRYLKATLISGVYFSIKNEDIWQKN